MTTRRRTKGEGSIIKTPNNKYRVRLDCGYVEGKRKQLSATCDTMAAARVKLREFEKIKEESNKPAGITMSLNSLIENFLSYKKKRREIKDTSYYAYTRIANTFPEWFKKMKVCDVNMEVLYKYADEEINRGFKTATIKSRLLFIKSLFNYAVNTLEIIPASPLKEHIKLPKDTEASIKNLDILSEQEHIKIRELLKERYENSIKNGHKKLVDIFYIAYMLTYELGLREGELLGLRWSRIDFKERTIIIDNQKVYIPRQGVLDSSPKTSTSNRVLIVSKGLIEILTKHKEHFRTESDYIFSKNGNKDQVWHRNTLIRIFNQVLLEVGITRKFTFHMIRHTNATRLIEKSGNNYKLVSERLGHASVSTTFDFYAHVIKKQHQLAAELMDSTL